MDEIKPVAWAFAQDWTQFQADRQECRLLPNFYYGEDLSLSSDYAALYDQQAIDTLRAEVERLTEDNGAYAEQQLQALGKFWDAKARAERAEAEAEALRKDAERYRWLRENGKAAATGLVMRRPETWDAAIDAAKQAAE